MGIVRVALTDSSDVARSLGAEGFLARRLGAGKNGAPEIEVTAIPAARIDLVAQQLGSAVVPGIEVPELLRPWFASHFEASPLRGDPVLVVLSIADALTSVVLRHKSEGFLVSPPTDPSDEEQAWLDSNFEGAPVVTSDLIAALEEIDRHISDREIEVVIYNVSTFIPDEIPHWLRIDDPEPISLLANRLDLVLDSVAARAKISVFDVDRVISEFGAGEAVERAGHYTDEACEAIGEEALAMISELPGISTLFGLDVMRLTVPRHDRRTHDGVLVEWHVTAPCAVKPGDDLFDVRFENIRSRLNDDRRQLGRALNLTVVATRDGYLTETMVAKGARVTAGATVGVITEGPETEAGDVEEAASFPVGVRVMGR